MPSTTTRRAIVSFVLQPRFLKNQRRSQRKKSLKNLKRSKPAVNAVHVSRLQAGQRAAPTNVNLGRYALMGFSVDASRVIQALRFTLKIVVAPATFPRIVVVIRAVSITRRVRV
jgi:hypothetical protein